MNKKALVKVTSTVMAFAMAVTLIPATGEAAAKKPKFALKVYPLFEGGKETVKIVTNGVSIKSTKWSTTDKSVFTVKKKSNTKAKITAVKPGEAKVKAKVTATDGKKYTLTSTVAVAEQEVIAGGWTTAQDPTITDEYKKMVESVADKRPEYKFTPIALLATQVVAGTNYRFFCMATKDNKSVSAILEIYQDLQGGTDILDTEIYTKEINNAEHLDGGWGVASEVKISDDEMKGFEKALEGQKEKYVPVAKVAQQVVAGFNYLVICEGPTDSRYDIEYYMAQIYVAPDNASFELKAINKMV